jgi:hypothetical protein
MWPNLKLHFILFTGEQMSVRAGPSKKSLFFFDTCVVTKKYADIM